MVPVINQVALGHLTLCRFPIEKKQLRHQQIYPNASGYTQGPGRAAAAWPPPGRRLVFCIYFLYPVYIWIYVGYAFLESVWHGYGTGSYMAQGQAN